MTWMQSVCLLKDDHFLLKLMSGMGSVFNILLKLSPGLEDFKNFLMFLWARKGFINISKDS